MRDSPNQDPSTSETHARGETRDSAAPPWWRRGVVYQVYIRSFADGNGDGTGDVAGLRSRVDYLANLGVDAIWVNPWYQSPLADGGYDVANYREIEPRYGSTGEVELLISELHAAGIRIIVDVVPNHTSVEHVWFAEAMASPKGSPARGRYHFRDGRGADGSEPPTNWTSVFGGPAWTRVDDGQWYLHLFDGSQPDLNWENDEVREEFLAVLQFWLDRGVDGFRVDVAHGLVKDMTWPDVAKGTALLDGDAVDHPFWDRDGVHPIVRSWRALLDQYNDRMMVAEAWIGDPERLARYLRPDEYQQSFNFSFLSTDWDAAAFVKVIASAVHEAGAVGSAPTWVLSNHDVVRHATRYGLPNGTDWRSWLLDGPHDILDAPLGARRARAAMMLMLALPGSAYVYMGDELGMPEAWDLPLDVLDDPVWERSSHTQKGRDGCRVPLPWTADGPSMGFGDGDSWLPQPAEWRDLAADVQQGDPRSTLEFTRQAFASRQAHFVADEELAWIETPSTIGNVVAFRRGNGAECWVNMGTEAIVVPAGGAEILRSEAETDPNSGDGAEVWLQPNDALWRLPV